MSETLINGLEASNRFRKTVAINDLIQVVTSAYSLGLSLNEVQAICGAVFGDWVEINENHPLL